MHVELTREGTYALAAAYTVTLEGSLTDEGAFAHWLRSDDLPEMMWLTVQDRDWTIEFRSVAERYKFALGLSFMSEWMFEDGDDEDEED